MSRSESSTDIGPDTDASLPSHGARTMVSLLLMIHLFCLFVLLSANLSRSMLQARLVDFLAVYARSLNLDPNFTLFHLTHAVEDHDDHLIEVELTELPEAAPLQLTHVGWRGGQRYKRRQRLAYVVSFFARREMDEITGELAQAIGRHVMLHSDATKVVVRCRWHRPQDMQLPQMNSQNPPDPLAPEYYQTIYEADVWVADDGSVQVLKRSGAGEVAPAESGAAR